MNRKQNSAVYFAFAIYLITLQIAYLKCFPNPDSLLLELKKPIHDTLKFDILLNVGDFYEYSQPDSAIVYYAKAVELADKNISKDQSLHNHFQKLMGKALRYIGYVHLNQGDYQLASQFYFEALDIAEVLNDKNSIYNCYNNIGIINHMQKEYDVAKEYYQKALDILEEKGDRVGKSKLFINVGNLYHDHGDNTDDLNQKNEYYSLALSNYSDALEIKNEIGDVKGQSLCVNNLGNLHKKMAKLTGNELDKKKMYSRSRDFYYKSILLSQSINDKSGLSLAYGNLSDLYSIFYKQNALASPQVKFYADSAIYFGLKSYQISVELNSIYLQNKTALLLKNIYTDIGDKAKALEFADIYIETRDKIFSDEKTKAIKEMLTRYDTVNKEKEIQLQQVELHKTRSRLVMVLSAAGIFIIVISFLVYVLRLRYKTEKLLETKNQQLNESNATKDKFFSIISHDLRTPVSGFRNLSALMGQQFDLLTPDQVRENLVDLSKSADETVTLLNNLLQWSKSQQGKISVSRFPVRVKRLCSKVADELGTKLKEKNIEVAIEIDNDLEVDIDENIISTVIRNFLSNAIKFSPQNSTIVIKAVFKGESLSLTVTDCGIGMTDDDVKKLFRVECDTKSIGNSPEKGSGLGLILCKELINLHGGEVQVTSQIGKGSTFGFTIPSS